MKSKNHPSQKTYNGSAPVFEETINLPPIFGLLFFIPSLIIFGILIALLIILPPDRTLFHRGDEEISDGLWMLLGLVLPLIIMFISLGYMTYRKHTLITENRIAVTRNLFFRKKYLEKPVHEVKELLLVRKSNEDSMWLTLCAIFREPAPSLEIANTGFGSSVRDEAEFERRADELAARLNLPLEKKGLLPG